ncbi:DegV family protein [Anaerosporobacter faecicola]|uniref:DegV family protein n=1 Tax=Anaerosporobacter faecicola TaxID=2718714 RepID=UPI00143AD26A|nr:DegV family protein [Anaerosporobacter faecicola]
MSYKVIGDSCTDLTKEMKMDEHFQIVSLNIDIDGHLIVDDDTFDQKDFLRRMAESPNCPKSSCPSPDAYMKAFEGPEEHVYVVTLSSKLSGSYESAMLAKRLYQEEHPDKNIEVFDSKSASVGQTLIARKIKQLEEEEKSFEEVVELTNEFRDHMKTKFVLETLDTLRKNGRLSNLKAIICSALNIKPVMQGTEDGSIEKLDQARGINKTLVLMADLIKKDATNFANRTLAIAHCNNYERAVFVKEEIMKRVSFKDCFICDTAGISSLYANDGGIIVCY